MPRHFDPADGSWELDTRLERDAHREPASPRRVITDCDRREMLALNFGSAFSRQGCSTSSHESLKLSPAWAALPLIGVQVVPADGSGPEERIALRNCPACFSTLAVVEVQS